MVHHTLPRGLCATGAHGAGRAVPQPVAHPMALAPKRPITGLPAFFPEPCRGVRHPGVTPPRGRCAAGGRRLSADRPPA